MNNDAKIKQFIKFLSAELYDPDILVNKELMKDILNLYATDYRHSYSDILNVLTEIENDVDGISAMGILSENIEIIKNELIPKQENKDVQKKFNKFYDHVVLEITRLDLFKKAHNEQKHLLNENDKIKRELQKARENLHELNEQLSNTKTEFVTILSIFAAIILTFSGGLGLNNNILDNLDKASIYKISTMAIIIGFVLFNTILGLMHIISKLVGKDISHKCSQCASLSCDSRTADESCNPFIRVRVRYPYVYYVNVLLIIALGIIFFAWFIEIKTIADYFRKGVLWNVENNIERIWCYGILCVFAIWFMFKYKFILKYFR